MFLTILYWYENEDFAKAIAFQNVYKFNKGEFGYGILCNVILEVRHKV